MAKAPFDESCRVLASLPPLVESYRPDLALKDHALAVKYYRSLVIETLDDLVDGWIAETLSSSAEVMDAMDAVSEHVLRGNGDGPRPQQQRPAGKPALAPKPPGPRHSAASNSDPQPHTFNQG